MCRIQLVLLFIFGLSVNLTRAEDGDRTALSAGAESEDLKVAGEGSDIIWSVDDERPAFYSKSNESVVVGGPAALKAQRELASRTETLKRFPAQ